MLNKTQKKQIERAERYAVNNIWESFSWHVDQLSIESESVCKKILKTHPNFDLVDEATIYGREMVIKYLKTKWGLK